MAKTRSIGYKVVVGGKTISNSTIIPHYIKKKRCFRSKSKFFDFLLIFILIFIIIAF